MISNMKINELYENAKQASNNSYSPYSEFPVGAAVLTRDGSVYLGTNVENASYGLTICAERVAVCNAIAAGKRNIRAVAIYGGKTGVAPCGACRQFIAEFGSAVVVVYSHNGNIVVQPIHRLLPDSFTKEELTK